MATRIQLKRSETPNSIPTTSDLRDKEVALNIADRTLFVNNNGTIAEVLNADPNDETIVPSMLSVGMLEGVGNTWYVSSVGVDKATVGSVNPRLGASTGNTNYGATPSTAFASLKYALENSNLSAGDTIIIANGTYTETFPLTVPEGITIKGDGIKSTIIKPSVATNDLDAFLIEGDCYIEDISVRDFYYNATNDTGYGFRLKSTYSVVSSGRRPYIQRSSVITVGTGITAQDPRGYNAGDAGRGALIDGSSVASTSAEAALLFNECTFIVPNSVGLYLKNGAMAEWLNSFTYFAADSIKGENPGGTGFKGQGKTRLKINNTTGTFNAADTITYYDTDGVSVLASGTIDSNDGTYIYVDGQGTGTFVEANQQTSGKPVTVNGDAQLDTAQQKFGTASLLLDGTGDHLSLAASSDFGFGTGDFAVEAFIRPTAIATGRIFDFRTANPEMALVISMNSSGEIVVNANGSNVITGGTITINTWAHIAVSRVSGVTSLFVDGTRVGSAYTDTNDYGSTKPLKIGRSGVGGGNAFAGYIDEVRISKGVGRYANAASITVPTTEFVVDTNTQLLLHFNGIDGSTNIIDGSVSAQDIRSSSGGTAQYIALADYTDFGAELRSIGSASVYGERGVTAIGNGSRLRCILHNFGYVGTGFDISNDISNVNQANEIIESTGGRVLFTSMDQNGDFRVGNAFFVDQENGTVSFVGGGEAGGTTFDQLVVTGTGDTTTILPTSISLGSLKFSGNTLESLSGDLELNAPSGNKVDVNNQLRVTDGTLPLPGLSFINDENTGLQRSGSGEINFVADGSSVIQTTPQQLNVFKDVKSQQEQVSGSLTINDGGVGRHVGSFTNIPTTTTGSGQGLTLNVTVTAFNATVSNGGSGYTVGNYSNVPITGGSGSGGTADVVVQGLENGSTNGGSGYANYAYGNVPLQGGNGTGAIVNMISSGGTLSIQSFISHGSNYQNGDVLTVNNSDLTYVDPSTDQTVASGGSNFSYTLGQVPYIVSTVSSPSSGIFTGDGYAEGESVGLNNATLGGGSNAAFTLDNVQFISSAVVANGGVNYSVGDSISIANPSIGSSGELVGIGQEVTINIAVRPASTTGNAFWMDLNDGNGYVEKPTLQLNRDTLYRFVYEEDGTEYDNHPIGFSTTSDGTWGSGDSDVDFVGAIQDDDIRLLLVPTSGPTTIYYFCTQHPGMGGSASVSGSPGSGESLAVATTSLNNTISIGVDGSTSFQTMNVASNTTLGSLQVNGTSTFNGSINAASISAVDVQFSNDLAISGTLTVTGETTEVSTFANDVAFDTNLLVVDAQEDRIGIKVAEPNFELDADISAKIYDNVVLSTTSGTGVSIGNDPGIDTNTELPIAPSDKLVVTGDAKFNNVIKLANGTAGAPSLTFSNNLSTGIYSTTPGTIGFTSTSGVILDAKADEFEFYRGIKFTSEEIGTFTTVNGSGYQDGTYTDIPTTGGDGAGLTLNFTVGFNNTVVTAGAGYDNATYLDLPFTNVSSASAGAVQGNNLNAGGQYYGNGSFTNLPLTGGNGSNAVANVTISSNVVQSVTVTNGGSSYQVGDILSLAAASTGGNIIGTLGSITGGSGYTAGTYTNIAATGGGGSGATLDITVTAGAVSAVTLNDPGAGYTTSSVLSVAGGDITEEVVDGLAISNSGVNYANGTYTGVTLTGGSGSGLTADITVSGQQITSISVNNGGLLYQLTDVVTIANIDDVGGLQGAAAIATLGEIVGGSGYVQGTYTNVPLTGGSGSGAQATIVVDSGGLVNNVTITNGGTGYSTSDTGLSASNTNLGGSGSSFSIEVETLANAANFEATVNSVIVGSGFSIPVSTVLTGTGLSLEVTSIASGTGGSGARGTIVTDENGAVTQAIVTTPGSGYSINDRVFVADGDMQYDDGLGGTATSAPPTTQFELNVDSFGGIQNVTISESGEGYSANDEISVNNTNVGNQGNGFSFTVDTIVSSTNVEINDDDGEIITKKITNLIDGINLDNKITILPTGISRISAGNLQLTAPAGNFVQITGTDAIQLPFGTTAQRPTGATGLVRFNTEELLFEGFDGNSFVSLGGTRDVDFDTFVLTESAPGEDEDTFFFYNANVNTLTLTQSDFTLNGVQNFKKTLLSGVSLWVASTAQKSTSEVSTFAPSSTVNYTDDTITLTDHNLVTGSVVTYSPGTGETPINPLVDATNYYVYVVDANTIKLSVGQAELNANTYINLASSPSHTGSAHTFTPVNPTPNLIYFGESVYEVTTSGTFGTTAPTHTTGAVANGTAVLTYSRNIYGDLTATLNNYFFTVDKLDVNTGSLIFRGDSTNAFIESESDSLIFAINNSKEFLKITESGGLLINRNFSGTTPSYVEVINSDLKKLELADYSVVTNRGTLVVTGGNALNVTTHPVSAAKSGKVQVEVEDSITSITYAVTIANSKYVLDGTSNPTLNNILVGRSYIFNQLDSTNNGNPLMFAETTEGPSEYITNVSYRIDGNTVDRTAYIAQFNSATTERSIQITIAPDAPTTLNYFNLSATGYGNIITTAERRKQYTEISYLINSRETTVYYTEINKIYTDDILVDVTADIASSNFAINITDLTNSSGEYDVKVVAHNILT